MENRQWHGKRFNLHQRLRIRWNRRAKAETIRPDYPCSNWFHPVTSSILILYHILPSCATYGIIIV